MTVKEKAVQWMVNLANDNSHGYDQIYRWGEKGDYDCSSAVISAYQNAGVPVKTNGATYTGNMRAIFLKSGFSDVTGKVDLKTGAGLEAGDVLLNQAKHTALYIGGGQEAEASINEKGAATGGKPGDQTGKEILVRPYRNFPWDCVLRFVGVDTQATSNLKKAEPIAYALTLREISLGSTGESVRVCQTLLRGYGYGGVSLEIDGEFGPHTDFAVKRFQLIKDLEVDGVVGCDTWAKLIGG